MAGPDYYFEVIEFLDTWFELEAQQGFVIQIVGFASVELLVYSLSRSFLPLYVRASCGAMEIYEGDTCFK